MVIAIVKFASINLLWGIRSSQCQF